MNKEEIIKQAEKHNQMSESIRRVLDRITTTYPKALGIETTDFLERTEKERDVNIPNWYQDSTYPDIGKVFVFNNQDEFFEKFPSKLFLCPGCKKLQKQYYRCDCGWSAGGLFGTLDSGIHVIIKTGEVTPTLIFTPKELVKECDAPQAQDGSFLTRQGQV